MGGAPLIGPALLPDEPGLAQPSWTVKLCGRLSVVPQQGPPVTRFRSRSAATVLAYLATFIGRFHEREDVALAVWGDSDPGLARQSLRTALASLRDLLEPGDLAGLVIQGDRFCVGLNADLVTTDALTFQEWRSAALRATDPRDQESALARALDSVAGPLLNGMVEPWALPQQIAFEELYAQTTCLAIDLLLERGACSEAVLLGRKSLTITPVREDVHVAVIRALGESGLSAEAVGQYEILERILDDQWGETPSSAARAALESLPKASALGRGQTREVASPLPEPNRRAVLLKTTFGRQQEKADLVQALRPGEVRRDRFWCVSGLGGSGKTTLALEALQELREPYEGRAWFVDLADTSDPSLIPARLCEAIGLAKLGVAFDLARVVDELGGKECLLVLDGCEQLAGIDETADVLLHLLRNLPGLRILVTSRRLFGLDVERAYPLQSLPVPGRGAKLKEVLESPCVQLFVDRAKAHAPRFEVGTNNAEAVTAVCQMLGGLPLAVEIAAAQMSTVTPAQLLTRLDSGSPALRRGESCSPNGSLQQVLEWTYSNLAPPEQELFRKLSVFSGGWQLEAAEEVAQVDQTAALLEALLSQGLVSVEETNSALRFKMLEPVRDFAYEKLAEHDERGESEALHRTWAANLALKQRPFFDGPAAKDAADTMDLEHDNLRRACDSALACPLMPTETLEMLGAMMHYCNMRGHHGEWLARAERMLGRPFDNSAVLARAAALTTAGNMSVATADYDLSMSFFEEALGIRKKKGQGLEIVVSNNNYALACNRLGRFANAKTACEEGLRLLDEPDLEPAWLASVARIVLQGNLATAFLGMDRPEEAESLLRESLMLANGLANVRVQVPLLLFLSKALADIEKDGEALSTAEEALTLAEEIKIPGNIAQAHLQLGWLFCKSDGNAARRHLAEAVATAHPVADVSTLAEALLLGARLLQADGAHEAAGQTVRTALGLDLYAFCVLGRAQRDLLGQMLSVPPPPGRIAIVDPRVERALSLVRELSSPENL